MRGMPAAPLLASLSPMRYNPIDRLTLGITPAGVVVLIPHLLHQAVAPHPRSCLGLLRWEVAPPVLIPHLRPLGNGSPPSALFFRPRWRRFVWIFFLHWRLFTVFFMMFWLRLFWREIFEFLLLLEIDLSVLTNFHGLKLLRLILCKHTTKICQK